MELQIQDLVSSIKKDGIESANREAAQILADAKAQAEKIVADYYAKDAMETVAVAKEVVG